MTWEQEVLQRLDLILGQLAKLTHMLAPQTITITTADWGNGDDLTVFTIATD